MPRRGSGGKEGLLETAKCEEETSDSCRVRSVQTCTWGTGEGSDAFLRFSKSPGPLELMVWLHFLHYTLGGWWEDRNNSSR